MFYTENESNRMLIIGNSLNINDLDSYSMTLQSINIQMYHSVDILTVSKLIFK